MSAEELVADLGQRLVEVRRDLHAHPETARQEVRTTQLVADALSHAGLEPRRLASGTGLVCEVGPGEPGLLLRADIDALPIADEKQVPYRSRTPQVAHACGHDVHTTVLLGTGLALARAVRSGELTHGVRLVFQPAEEVIPGGATDIVEQGLLHGVRSAYALHCDPSLEVGKIGLLAGPITSASDLVEVTLRGPGGHTARPHLTADVVAALGAVVSQSGAVLARRMDPRAGVSLVWGEVHAGSASNVMPREGRARGTLRCLDHDTWVQAPELVRRVLERIAEPYGVEAHVRHVAGVPPVDNHPRAVEALRAAAGTALGPDAAVPTTQSLGGEDFGWFCEKAEAALARLGTRSPGSDVRRDLHQSDFDVDERCIAVGVRLLTRLALDGG